MKKIIIAAVLIVFLVLLISEPFMLTDGGTIKYKAILYCFVNRHSIYDEGENIGHIVGKELYILGIMVFDNTKFVSVNDD